YDPLPSYASPSQTSSRQLSHRTRYRPALKTLNSELSKPLTGGGVLTRSTIDTQHDFESCQWRAVVLKARSRSPTSSPSASWLATASRTRCPRGKIGRASSRSRGKLRIKENSDE